MEISNRTKSYYKWAFSNELAIGSFIIGTLLFLTYKAIPHDNMVMAIGTYYILFAIFINTIMLFYLIFLCIILPDERKKIALKIIFLLCNIPVSLLHFYIILDSECANSPF
jgi:hypothetical protein